MFALARLGFRLRFGLVIVLIAATVTPGARAAIATPPTSCSGPIDPYAYTREALAACGLKTFPLSVVRGMPGGGSDYSYDLGNGVVAHEYVVPTGFDAAIASNAQLEEYALPLRPNDLASLPRWQAMMSHFKLSTPAPFLVESTASAGGGAASASSAADAGNYTFLNWSGYGICTLNGSTCPSNTQRFTETGITYIEPSFNNTLCNGQSLGPAEVTWAGIGGWASGSTLAQDGTLHGIPALPNHAPWYEVWPNFGILLFNNNPNFTTASVGDTISADTHWDPAVPGYSFSVYDFTTNQGVGAGISGVPYTGDSAEAIAERPTERIGSVKYYTPLSNFPSPINFTSAWSGSYFNSFDPNTTRWGLHMVNLGGTDLTDPSGIGTNGSFTETWHACGTVDRVPGQ